MVFPLLCLFKNIKDRDQSDHQYDDDEQGKIK